MILTFYQTFRNAHAHKAIQLTNTQLIREFLLINELLS